MRRHYMRLLTLLAVLAFSVDGYATSPRAFGHASRRFVVSRKTSVLGSPAPCFLPGSPPVPLTITAPTDNLAVSAAVPLSIARPTDTTDSVNVCASYYFVSAGQPTHQQNVLVKTLNAADSWQDAWDVSGFPSQRGITLAFIAHDSVSGQQAPVGTIQGLVIDRQPPASTAAIQGAQHYTTPGGITYVAASAPISVSATDPPLDDGSTGSGVRSISYQVDGGTAQTFAAPFSLSSVGDGPHTITYWAGDAAGNVETPHMLGLVLDATPPVVTPLVTGALNPDGSATGPVTVTFVATDTGSGVRGISYAIEPGFAQPYTPGQQPLLLAALSHERT
jgi:hypothetical protein